jgi:hypothetical protein
MEVDEKWVVGEHQLAVCRSDVNVSNLSFAVLKFHVTSLPASLPFIAACPLLLGGSRRSSAASLPFLALASSILCWMRVQSIPTAYT